MECYKYSFPLSENLKQAYLEAISTMQKTFFLTQNRDFRDFGDDMKKKILKKVLNQEVKLEMLDSIVEEEVYSMINM